MRQDGSVKQIHDWRQVYLGAGYPELCDVTNPHFVRCVLDEASAKHVVSNVADSATVGVVLLTPDLRYQSQLSHEPANHLLVDDRVVVAQRTPDTAIAKRGVEVVKDRRNLFLEVGVLVWQVKTTLVIKKR